MEGGKSLLSNTHTQFIFAKAVPLFFILKEHMWSQLVALLHIHPSHKTVVWQNNSVIMLNKILNSCHPITESKWCPLTQLQVFCVIIIELLK